MASGNLRAETNDSLVFAGDCRNNFELYASDIELKRGHVDFFAGVDFHYRDIMFRKLYELLINITPGVKWYAPYNWELAAQVYVPVLNDYGRYFNKVKLNVATISKQFAFGRRFFLKGSAGIFSNDRYGVDAKAMVIAADWLAFEGEAGLTGLCYCTTNFHASTMRRFTGHLGVDFYIPSYDTQFRLRGGKYVYTDCGVQLDIMRHFKHCTVGVYGQWSNKGGQNAGFNIAIMLPPYKRTMRKVNVRPASVFEFDYAYYASDIANVTYKTDPEENAREGWFSRTLMKWGNAKSHEEFLYSPSKSRKGEVKND